MQDICDELTDQGVLKVPQHHNIIVQSVCPSFLRRKRKAADTPTHLLTKNDVHLITNFASVNDLIKNIPSPTQTTDDIYRHLGRWKEIITIDLKSAFFQNHMDFEAQPYLGIMTPFGGLRVLTRSG